MSVETMQTRDIIVVGSSMGGVEALSQLVQQLPANLPAAVCIVQHTTAASPGLLSQILTRRGNLPAVTAADGMDVRPGHVYVAPPNRHLLLTDAGLRVTFGPRENGTRPAIDALFRTAAVHYRSRVIGLVLTGLQSDGAAGLLAVAQCGGVAVVQAPSDAAYPEMPSQALIALPEARQVALADVGAVLVELTSEPAPTPPAVPEMLRLEARLTAQGAAVEGWQDLPGEATHLTCTECRGPLRLIRDDGWRRFRCRVGHASSAADLLSGNSTALEQSLWVALQTLQQRAVILENLAKQGFERGQQLAAANYEEQARELRSHATRLRTVLADLADESPGATSVELSTGDE